MSSTTLISRLPSRSASFGRVTSVKAHDGTPVVTVVARVAGQRVHACAGDVVVGRASRSVASCAEQARKNESVFGRLAPEATLLCRSQQQQQMKVKVVKKPSIFPKQKRRVTWAAKLTEVKVFSTATDPSGEVDQGTSAPAPSVSVSVSTSDSGAMERERERVKFNEWLDRNQRMLERREALRLAKDEAMERELVSLAAARPVVAVAVIPPSPPAPVSASQAAIIRRGPPALPRRRPIGCNLDLTKIKPVRFPVELLVL